MPAEIELRAVVADLRPMDVVVVKGVQLAVFDGEVVGRMGRGSEMWIVQRLRTEGRVERGEWRRRWEGGLAGEKVRECVRWAEGFMGGGLGGGSFLEGSGFWPEGER